MSGDCRIVWSDNAASMLDEIVTSIAEDSPRNAEAALDRIRTRVGRLSRSPQGGRYVPELLEFGIRTYREVIVKPWRVIYRSDKDTVHILVVIDARRNVSSYLLRELYRRNL
ncbi:MAG: type II toxin-antitoxin system RelE/ParE family toxin [Coriobacteriales bacterium]|jgi:plasmid stabilization system protein ParE|nr:type II toxin-antitoxin system RelE/ParE family toxin [Coriobacteriales bacterium]